MDKRDEDFTKTLMDMVAGVRISDEGNVKASMFLGETVEFEAGLTDHPHLPNVLCPVLTLRVPLADQEPEIFNFVLGSPGAVLKLHEAMATMIVNATYLPVIRANTGLDELIAKTKEELNNHDEGSSKPN